MAYIQIIFTGSIFGLIPLLPMAAFFHAIRLKMDNLKTLKPAIPHMLASYLFCFVLLSILTAIGIPGVNYLEFSPQTNFVPFIDIHTNSLQYMQNILLFIPFGFLLPLLWKRFEKIIPTIIFGALFSLSIEAIQIFCPRITDIDDLLMNTAGTIIGYFLFIITKRVFPKISVFSADDSNHWKGEPYLYFALAWLVMFLIEPYISNHLLSPMTFSPGSLPLLQDPM